MKRCFVILAVMLAASVMTAAMAQIPLEGSSKPAKSKKQRVEPSFAWSVSDPLGLHFPSTIDTLFLDYHRTMVPSLVSDAWLTTGNCHFYENVSTPVKGSDYMKILHLIVDHFRCTDSGSLRPPFFERGMNLKYNVFSVA